MDFILKSAPGCFKLVRKTIDIPNCDDNRARRQPMAKERLVVIGGDAAGMSAASQVRRRKPDMEIIAFERGRHTSYAA
jgi:hypothetical protein